MAKGLSDTQKNILKVISEMPEGSKLYEVNHKIKAILFPDLYVNSERWYYGSVKNYGKDTKKKNSARATMCRSVRRLAKRELLTIDNDWRVSLTTKGKSLMVNDVLLITNH